ncbi:MAG TPA: PIN domain-containing protein [Spirochaetota bacterium]|jgi:predicted nucleic acid-binding protein|nr:MAG: PIN domain protein [Spirochaetes bacterium ADurb.Bin133]HNZ27240.1 PIN domain-containing protein [Spirochaetota bacterium]HPY87105.1 PIN domain-containing protein [Spirochaetota bacterium]HQB60709.1 PIN domain-containing protein [Spirochaetota bacterium]
MNKIVLDTNILIYSIDRNSIYYEFSNKLINSYDCFITSKNITEFVNVLSKNKNIEYSFIEKKFLSLYNNFTVLYTNKNSLEIFKDFVIKYKPVGNKIFDIEIASIMLSSGIDTIGTVNKSDFENMTEIKIINA